MRNRNSIRPGLFLVGGIFLTMMTGMMVWQTRQSDMKAPYGRYTKSEITRLSQPLCQVMLPGTTNMETNVYTNITFNPTGQVTRYWDVDMFDPATGDNAHILWNADTGELMRASRLTHKDQHIPQNANSTLGGALGLAWDWFHALNIRRSDETWRIVATRKRQYAQWEIYLRAGDRYTMLILNTVSGQLVQAVCGHLPDSNTAWNPVKSEPLS